MIEARKQEKRVKLPPGVSEDIRAFAAGEKISVDAMLLKVFKLGLTTYKRVKGIKQKQAPPKVKPHEPPEVTREDLTFDRFQFEQRKSGTLR